MLNLSILLPTRGRPSLVYRLFESLSQTTSDAENLEVILYLDEDDIPSHEISYPLLKIIKLIRPVGKSMGKMIRECYEASQGRYIIIMNDDAVFRTKGWDLSVMEAFSRFPDDVAFVYANDLDRGRRMPTFPILSRKVCELTRGVCPDGYLNLYIDAHLLDVFNQLKRLGHDRIIYLKNVIVEHMHYALGKSEHDKTYVKKSPSADDRLFVALAEERRNMARRLAQYIETQEDDRIELPENGEEIFQGVGEPIVSIVVPIFSDDIDRLPRAIDSILNRTSGQTSYEVIAVLCGDDADRATLSLLNQKGKVKIIQKKEKLGFAKMCNQGTQEARGDFLIFVSHRAVLEPGWIDALVKAAETSDDIAVVGCKHLHPRNGRIQHAGISFFNDAGKLKFTYIYKGVRSDTPMVNRTREFQAVSVACMLVRRKVFSEAGGFDETLNGMEDIDLCLRIRERGMKVVYTPEATIYNDDDVTPAKNVNYLKDSPVFISRWIGRIENDLEKILKEDGFSLCKTSDHYLQLSPSIS
jgi:GT2 family glycosyltransferase